MRRRSSPVHRPGGGAAKDPWHPTTPPKYGHRRATPPAPNGERPMAPRHSSGLWAGAKALLTEHAHRVGGGSRT
eukprot:1016259-Alexandrium_andersonii.AAC.1